MRDTGFRARLRRVADAALLAAFLALTAVAYGAFFIGVRQFMTTPVPEFSDFYQSGKNPWAAAITEPAAPLRLANTAAGKHGAR